VNADATACVDHRFRIPTVGVPVDPSRIEIDGPAVQAVDAVAAELGLASTPAEQIYQLAR
jgi:hypothetical protein